MNKINVLAIVSHPDDAELAFGGTLARLAHEGKKVGVIDMTQGEMGTRGNASSRASEANQASEILGLSLRENLKLEDSYFQDNPQTKNILIDAIRRYQPDIVFTNAPSDRHPDHGRASKMVADACFYSGLKKIETQHEHWRPKKVFFGIQSHYLKPDFLFDVSLFWQKKMEAVLAYKTQFYNPQSSEEPTFISTPEFLQFLEARAREWGQAIGVKYAEGFIAAQPFGVMDFDNFI
jgi:bacillithiol biosynthesis deacetylase BshB1